MMIWWEDIFYEAFPSRVKLWDRVFISRAAPASTPPSNQRTQNVHTLVIVQQCVETLRSRKQTWLIFGTINILTLYLEFASNLQSESLCKHNQKGHVSGICAVPVAEESQVSFATNREFFFPVEMFRFVLRFIRTVIMLVLLCWYVSIHTWQGKGRNRKIGPKWLKCAQCHVSCIVLWSQGLSNAAEFFVFSCHDHGWGPNYVQCNKTRAMVRILGSWYNCRD